MKKIRCGIIARLIMLKKLFYFYHDLPAGFRVLLLAMFVDRLGGTILYPFFALYITRTLQVGMTEAGILLGLFSLFGVAGSMVGGAMADKIGRRRIVIFGLLSSAAGSVVMAFLHSLPAFYITAAVVGFLGNIASPAHQAMVADLLPESRRVEGFGLLRIAANLSWILGPTLGGLLAQHSYALLFIVDAIASTAAAWLVFHYLPETKPQPAAGSAHLSWRQTTAGYLLVARDRLFIAFLLATALMLLVYGQMYHTLAVFLRDVHGVSDGDYGRLISIDALTVVLLQAWVSRRVRQVQPLLLMALGAALYLVGFTMFGFVAGYALFVLAILIITFGEMIAVPVGQALAARFAPDDMLGRYMAFVDFGWAIPATIGPTAAGLILDNYTPQWVWYACGLIAAAAVAGFLWLHTHVAARFNPLPEDSTS